MPDVFEYSHVVDPQEIDELGHANNVAYVAWLQAAAVAHSAAQGWPGALISNSARAGWSAGIRSNTFSPRWPATR